MRPDWKPWLIAPLLCIWPQASRADDSETAKLVSECGSSELPQASVDSCLERVRVLEETEPSAKLQTLEANLERRESGPRVIAHAAVAPAEARRAEVREMPVQHESVQEHKDSDTDARFGAEAEDEPPIADPPDTASEQRSMDDQPDDPQR